MSVWRGAVWSECETAVRRCGHAQQAPADNRFSAADAAVDFEAFSLKTKQFNSCDGSVR